MSQRSTVAELLIERLIDWGVDTIFGLPGDGINGIFEALRTHAALESLAGEAGHALICR